MAKRHSGPSPQYRYEHYDPRKVLPVPQSCITRRQPKQED
jgi:hypothetical protein